MIFSETKLAGAYLIDIEKSEDDRGFFSRLWDKDEFSKKGLDSNYVQISISGNIKKGTIRGMHYQANPYEETKIVRCTRGKIYDVIIDLRRDSKTFKEWFSAELSADNYKMMYVPKGFAHGFQTLEDDSEVTYQISQEYMPEFSKGIKWSDAAINITWPMEPTIISQRDRAFPDFG